VLDPTRRIDWIVTACAQRARDRAEHAANAAAQSLERDRRGDGDHDDDESVFNETLAALGPFAGFEPRAET
jgi:hypothetical protein